MKNPWKKYHLGFTVGAIFLVVFNAIRCFLLPLTHDESHSLLHHIPLSIHGILYLKGQDPTNNHVLNTLVAKLFLQIFGIQEWSLRLGSAISFAVYIGFFLGIIHRFFQNIYVKLLMLSIAVFNPFAFEFFSLARGYSYSMAFMTASLYCLFVYLNERNADIKFVYGYYGFGVLSALANFSYLYYILLLVFWDLVFLPFLKKDVSILSNLKRYRFHLGLIYFLFSVSLLYILQSGSRLNRLQQLYFGGTKNFFSDTMGSLARSTLFETQNLTVFSGLLTVFFSALVLGSLVLFFQKFKIRELTSPGFILSYFILGFFALSNLTHYMLGQRFFIERTALIYLPLFGLVSGVYFEQVMVRYKPFLFIAVAIGIGLFLNFFANLTLYESFSWKFDRDSRSIAQRVVELSQGQEKTYCSHWKFHPSLLAYFKIHKASHIAVIDPQYAKPKKPCDLIFVEPDANPMDGEMRPSTQYREIQVFSTGTLWQIATQTP